MKRKYEIITSVLVVMIIIGALIFSGERGSLKKEGNLFNWNEKGGNVKILIPTGVLSSYYADMINGKEVILDTSNGDITLENLKDKESIIDKLKVSTSNAEENINANYNNKK